jgi:hypothetical protein
VSIELTANTFVADYHLLGELVANLQECTALHLGLRPLSRAYAQLSAKVKSEEEDLQRLADIWSSYRPSDGRPSNLRAGALRDFRKGSVMLFFLGTRIVLDEC